MLWGGFRRPLRDAVFCSVPYPPVELASYFREPLRGIAFKLGELCCSWTVYDRSGCAAVGSVPTAAFADGYDCSVLRVSTSHRL